MANSMAGLPSHPGKQTTQAAVLLRSCFISFKRAAMATIANALTFPVDPLDQVTENADSNTEEPAMSPEQVVEATRSLAL